jgi:hypothetical protein
MKSTKSSGPRFKGLAKVTELTLIAVLGSTVGYCIWFMNVVPANYFA